MAERKEVKYAKAGGPPEFWQICHVVHVPSGQDMEEVVEANVEEGWVRRYAVDAGGKMLKDENGDGWIEKVECEIRIEVRG